MWTEPVTQRVKQIVLQVMLQGQNANALYDKKIERFSEIAKEYPQGEFCIVSESLAHDGDKFLYLATIVLKEYVDD